MTPLPKHGKINCSKCFGENSLTWGASVFEENGWRLENNPCSWGSQNPIVLTLGFSKGTNQTRELLDTPFNDIPFRGFRSNLTRIMRILNLLSPQDSVDEKISKNEPNFAFGSLIRCSISKKDVLSGKFLKSGSIINLSSSDTIAQKIIENCMGQHLGKLPPRLKLVVMLSNDDEYVLACVNAIRKIHNGVSKLNDVAYGNNQVTWVHVIHPSGASGRHIGDWLSAPDGKQAKKRELAKRAVRQSGALDTLNVAELPR
jgi:hypothetical protein